MTEYSIDLTGKKKGVTLSVDFGFKGEVTPFLVFITDSIGGQMYYYRQVNKGQVSINLPVHSDRINLYSSAYKPKSVLICPLKIYKMDYHFNSPIVQKRPYKFEEIREEYLSFIPMTQNINGHIFQLPSDQPARFLPSTGLTQFSNSVFEKIPQPVVEFIKRHEKGHYYYGRPLPNQELWKFFTLPEQAQMQQTMLEDEEEADRYSLYSMINDGYNFSGALNSLTDFLSDNYLSKERMKKLYSIISQEHKNHENEWA